MTLNSLPYAAFLVIAAALHSRLRPWRRNGFLLAVSWLFYVLCAPRFLPLLLASTVLCYGLGLAMEARPGWRKGLLAAGLVLGFGVLFAYKYLGFFGRLASSLLGRLGLAPLALPVLVAPVGLSFYTFTLAGYLVDVCRGKRPAERNFCDFALFASFFPAVLSGPIERADHLLPQLKEHRRANAGPTAGDVKAGVTRFLLGLAKKMILADQLAIAVNTAFANPAQFTGVQLLLAAMAYSLQIYCDFSAYSDMAIGSGRLLGITLLENFNAPYLCRSIQDFWRRWHISLSSWFRDYLYIPLGGSRRGTVRKYGNVLIVFAVSGLWHGAAVTFLVWGLLNGLYQVAGALLAPARRRVREALRLREDGTPLRLVQAAVCFLLLTVAWVFFRAESLGKAGEILGRIATMAGGVFPLGVTALGLSRARLLAVCLAAAALFVLEVLGQKRPLTDRLCATVWPRYAVWVGLVLAIAVFGAYGAGYDAQEFVYFQF